MTFQIGACIAVFIIMIALLAWNRYPMGVTGLITLALLVLLKCLEPDEALSSFGNSNLIVIVGMFVVGAGLRKTSLVRRISDFIRKATGGSFMKAYTGVIILAVVLTTFLTSPTVVYSILFPIMNSVCDEFDVSPSKTQFPLFITGMSCCSILPFGYAISQAAVFDGLMETYGFSGHFRALDFTVGRFPMIPIILFWALFLAFKFTPDKPIIPIIRDDRKHEDEQPLSKFQDLFGSSVFFLTIVCLIFNEQLGIEAWIIVLVSCILNLLSGVLSAPEAIRNMPMDLGFMFVGSNALASALVKSGASELIGDYITKILGDKPSAWLLSAVFYLVPFVLTQVMRNSSVLNIFAPICLLTCSAIGADPKGLLVLLVAAGRTAYMTPSAAPGIPMMMAAGGYDIKSVLKMGWLYAVITAVFYIVYVTLMMPAV